MLAVIDEDFKRILEFGENFLDTRLAGPSDGKRYEWRKMIDLSLQLGRPLTDEEAERFRIE